MSPRANLLVALVALASALVAACAGESGPSPAERYLSGPSARRATLEASLVNRENGYSRRRLEHYESGDAQDWSRLAEWNPRVDVVAASELDAPAGVRADAPLGPSARALAVEGVTATDEAALVALGREAFFRYPVQLAPTALFAARSRASLSRYGFWTDDTHGAGGLVRAEVAGGARVLAFSCATCHASTGADGALAIGVGNQKLDLGRLAFDAAAPQAAPNLVSGWLAWGPGRTDVTTIDGSEPVRIADLRPVRWLTHLHADASVAQRDLATLAVRIETLMITSQGESVRPPRVVALGLAAFLWSLADALPSAPPRTAEESRGAEVFRGNCAVCHGFPALTGAPIPLAAVGTDPTVGLSADRGTGSYRVPSLHGVATRNALFHDASLSSVDEVLDPARVRPDFAGGRRGPGAVPGHVYGLSLDDASRASLLAYLHTL